MNDIATPVGAWLTLWPVAIPMVFATIALMLRHRVRAQHMMAVGAHALTLLFAIILLERVVKGGPLAMTMGNWLPPFGISFAVDTLSAVMVVASSLATLLVAVYATADTDTASRRYGFFPLLLMLQVGVNGAFLTGDIFNLYVWFEVLLIASFGLLVSGGRRAQLDGAVKYSFLNLLATTFFLIATGLLYGQTGTLNMADLARTVPALEDQGPMQVIAVLFAFAFGMKAAAFPVFFWLPASYHTPKDAVSAVFAGLLTKVGVYALIRTFTIILPGNPGGALDVLLWAGIATILVAAIGALAQSDLKRLLGYLVISGIGMMLLGLGLGTPLSLAGAIFYAVHSIIVMTGLYLMAGIVRRMTRSTDLHRAAGIYGVSPLIAGMFLVLAFAVAGLPPFSGFWPKVVFVQESLAVGSSIAAAAVLLSGILTTIAVGRSWALAFWRPQPQMAEGEEGGVSALQTDERTALITPIAVLILVVVLIGVVPGPLFGLTESAVATLFDPARYIEAVFGATP